MKSRWFAVAGTSPAGRCCFGRRGRGAKAPSPKRLFVPSVLARTGFISTRLAWRNQRTRERSLDGLKVSLVTVCRDLDARGELRRWIIRKSYRSLRATVTDA